MTAHSGTSTSTIRPQDKRPAPLAGKHGSQALSYLVVNDGKTDNSVGCSLSIVERKPSPQGPRPAHAGKHTYRAAATNCSKPAPKPTPAPKASSASKAKTISCKTGTCCTSGTRGECKIALHCRFRRATVSRSSGCYQASFPEMLVNPSRVATKSK